MSDSTTPRRGFLGRATAATAALLGLTAAPSLASSPAEPDEPWLKGLSGKHRQYFDVGTVRDARALTRVTNYLDVYRDVYRLTDAEANAIVGAHGGALAIVMNDALWSKYELGKRNSANDPLTKLPVVRNPYVRREPSYEWSVDYSVMRLQSRGVRFLACMRSIRALSMELAGDNRGAIDAINGELLAGLLPEVTPVPAMIVAINRAQEAGFAYVFAG